jgi:hypothetical protein
MSFPALSFPKECAASSDLTVRLAPIYAQHGLSPIYAPRVEKSGGRMGLGVHGA